MFSPGITENPPVPGSEDAKRWLTPGATPPGWHSPGPSCSITNSQGKTVASFVEIVGVARGPWMYEDCRTSYDAVNGGSPLPRGHWCDSDGDLYDPALVPNFFEACVSPSDPTCRGIIHVEFDGDWFAAGYCGAGTACDNNTLVHQTVSGSLLTLVDVQGFVYWDPGHLNETWHGFSGWELHPLTAWRIHQPSPPLAGGFDCANWSCSNYSPPSSMAVASNGTAESVLSNPSTCNYQGGFYTSLIRGTPPPAQGSSVGTPLPTNVTSVFFFTKIISRNLGAPCTGPSGSGPRYNLYMSLYFRLATPVAACGTYNGYSWLDSRIGIVDVNGTDFAPGYSWKYNGTGVGACGWGTTVSQLGVGWLGQLAASSASFCGSDEAAYGISNDPCTLTGVAIGMDGYDVSVAANLFELDIGTGRPVVSYLSVAHGYPNTQILVTGESFNAAKSVSICGVSAPFIVSSDNTILTVAPQITSGLPQVCDVQVTSSVGGQSAISPSDRFTVDAGSIGGSIVAVDAHGGFDNCGAGSGAWGGRLDWHNCPFSAWSTVISTTNPTDVIVVIVTCRHTTDCNPVVTDGSGSAFQLRANRTVYPSSCTGSFCSWSGSIAEFYYQANRILTLDNVMVRVTSSPDKDSMEVLALANVGQSIWDPSASLPYSTTGNQQGNTTFSITTSPSFQNDFVMVSSSANNSTVCGSGPSAPFVGLDQAGPAGGFAYYQAPTSFTSLRYSCTGSIVEAYADGVCSISSCGTVPARDFDCVNWNCQNFVAPSGLTVDTNGTAEIRQSNPGTCDWTNSFYDSLIRGTPPPAQGPPQGTSLPTGITQVSASLKLIDRNLGAACSGPSGPGPRYHLFISLYYQLAQTVSACGTFSGASWLDTQVRVENINGADSPMGTISTFGGSNDPAVGACGFSIATSGISPGSNGTLAADVVNQCANAELAWGIPSSNACTLTGVEIGTEGFDLSSFDTNWFNLTMSNTLTGGSHAVHGFSLIRGTNNGLYWNSLSNAGWAGWQQIPGATLSTPALCPSSPGRIDVVIRGTDGSIYHSSFTNGVWSGSWDGPGGGTLDSPSCAVLNGLLYVAVRGTDNGTWVNSLNMTTGRWASWVSLGGGTLSTPVLVATPSLSRLDVVIRGTDNSIYHMAMTGGQWSGVWDSPGGATLYTPAVVSDSVSLQVVVTGTDHGVWYNSLNLTTGSWSGWSVLSGSASAAPALTIDSSGTVNLVVKGTDNGIWHKSKPSGGSWSAWDSPGGGTRGTPAVTMLGGKMFVVVTGTDSAIWFNEYGSGWSNWTGLGGSTPSAPSLSILS
ncbi:MAG TPA: IPT/TIG domain-containing protein [Candidatus Angelobacter sp.]|nr:IPT/TIG domain-containing protein [Candidatus Angelobacter sp.]